MTIIEARDILIGAKELPMFDSQAKLLTSIVEKVNEIIRDLNTAYARQTKKKKQLAQFSKPEEYKIKNEFKEHLESLSRLVNAHQWTETVADFVGIESNRAEQYIEICVAQTDGFVEELRQDVCVDIADITLDGETKQWISTLLGLIVDIVLLVFYGLVVFHVGPFSAIQISDAVAGFIGAVASVLTIALTLIFCVLINRTMIRRFDKNHVIKYRELVRASKRSTFKKSIMLMSFGEDLEELKKGNREIYDNTNKLLLYSITAEKVLDRNSQQLDVLKNKLDISLLNEENMHSKIDTANAEIQRLQSRLETLATEASTERQQFHAEATEQRRSHQGELKKYNEQIKRQNEIIAELKRKTSSVVDKVCSIQDVVVQLPQTIEDVVQSLPTQGSTSWKCKVCLRENEENVALCCDCGSDRNIADNVIESTRKKFEPDLIARGYSVKEKFICIPKDYAGQCLLFDGMIRLQNKIVFIPQEITSIDLSTLLPNLDKRTIKVRVESECTVILNSDGFTIEGND